jgi:uncharacterized membrane protein YvlD (DUF360 family)
MTLFEALENRDQYFDADAGYQLQRWVSLTLAILAGIASLFGWGMFAIVAGFWFLLATGWPAVIGRVTAMLTIVFAAVIIAMADTTVNNLIRPLLALATIPMIFVSALLASRRFADTVAVTCLYLLRRILKRGPFSA